MISPGVGGIPGSDFDAGLEAAAELISRLASAARERFS